jgi:uncharacterized protein YjbI with pentapeptide repeats
MPLEVRRDDSGFSGVNLSDDRDMRAVFSATSLRRASFIEAKITHCWFFLYVDAPRRIC